MQVTDGNIFNMKNEKPNLGQYEVWLCFGMDTVTYTTIYEDGMWKISDTGDWIKEFAPDGYEYSKGFFDTLEEALVIEEENPF